MISLSNRKRLLLIGTILLLALAFRLYFIFVHSSYLEEEYKGKLPNAEHIGKDGFYIGCHQYLEKEDLDTIIKTFDSILKEV